MLNDNNLSTLPNELCELTNLTKLELRNNQLQKLPISVGKLEMLKV